MHVVHVVQLYDPVNTGAGRYFREIGEGLVREGHRVTVLTTDAYDLEYFWNPARRRIDVPEEVRNGIRIVRLPVQRLSASPLLYPVLRRLMVETSRFPGTTALLRMLAQVNPRLPEVARAAMQLAPFDLVHTTNITLDFAIFPAYAAARAQGVPFICTPFVHLGEPNDPAIRRYYTMRHQIDLLRHSDRVIVQTGLEEAALARLGVPPERMRRVGVGVTPAELAGGDAARFRAEHDLHGPVVLYIGALAFDKGAIHTVQAMQRLWAQSLDADLVLIGAPLAHFIQFYQRLPAADQSRIRLLPYAPESVKRDALAAADVFTMPSRTDSFGIVYLEAWCYRVPVIGARAGGVPDVIRDGEDGLLVRFGAVDELAAALRRLLDDRTLAQRLGESGAHRVQRELTWAQKYAQVRAVYDEVFVQRAS